MLEDIDLEKQVPRGGMRQFDLHIAKLPTGTHINIHVFVYRGRRPGPVLLLTGGLHGDEVNGTETIRRMMAEKILMPDAGTIIAIPVLNIYGFLNFARDLPDGKDANRSFPGTKNGSLASRMAYTVTKKILPHIDFGIDFHTGAGTRGNFPHIRCDFEDKMSMELAAGFRPHFIVHSGTIPQSLRNEAVQMGKRIIVFEGGQAQRFTEPAIKEGMAGTLRLMADLDMIKSNVSFSRRARPKYLSKTTWVRAENAGLFHADVEEGQRIDADQRIGTITDPYNDYEVDILSPVSGYVIGLNYTAVINAGDALVHIGCDEGRK